MAEWFAEDPLNALYCVGGVAIVGFAVSWSWHNRRGK